MSEGDQEAPNRDRVAALSRLAVAAELGQFEDLECPNCNLPKVSVWFTHPARDEYRTWFFCAHCEFHSRAHNAERPAFFAEDRLRADLEERDRSILERAIFKRPPF